MKISLLVVFSLFHWTPFCGAFEKVNFKRAGTNMILQVPVMLDAGRQVSRVAFGTPHAADLVVNSEGPIRAKRKHAEKNECQFTFQHHKFNEPIPAGEVDGSLEIPARTVFKNVEYKSVWYDGQSPRQSGNFTGEYYHLQSGVLFAEASVDGKPVYMKGLCNGGGSLKEMNMDDFLKIAQGALSLEKSPAEPLVVGAKKAEASR